MPLWHQEHLGLKILFSQVALSVSVGGGWHPLLCGGLRVHHLRRLRPFL